MKTDKTGWDTDDSAIALVTFGHGGDTVYYRGPGSCTCSGYGDPESPHAAAGKAIPDGTPVVDVRAAVDTPEGFRWVLRGPMPDVNLKPAAVNRCPEPSRLFASAVAGNAFGGLLLAQEIHRTGPEKDQPGPLDSVDVATYVAGWKAHGARTGHYEAGRIIWDT